MKKILPVIIACALCACAAQATINGFVINVTSGFSYSVPSTNILAIESVSFGPSVPASALYLTINNNGNSGNVYFQNVITNGYYTLPKPLLVPGGATVSGGPNGTTVMGALIDSSDAPLFVGVGSSLTNLVVSGDTLTGTLQLSRTAAGSRVLFQSSTNLLVWCFDGSVMVLPGANDTQRQFVVPIGNTQRFYRALVRRQLGS